MLQLFPCLDQKISPSRWELDGNSLPCIAGPDVKTWVPWTAMDGQKVEIRMESGQNGIFFTIFIQIWSGGCQDMRTMDGLCKNSHKNYCKLTRIFLLHGTHHEVIQGQWKSYPRVLAPWVWPEIISDMECVHLRVFHRFAPLFHRPHPSFLQFRWFGSDIGSIQALICSFIWWFITHLPEKPAFRIGEMTTDIQRPLFRDQTCNDIQTRLIDGTFGPLSVLEGNTDLIA